MHSYILKIRIKNCPHNMKEVLPALTSRHNRTLCTESLQGNSSFTFIATTDAVGDDVYSVTLCQEIYCRLGHADVCFDAHNGHLVRMRTGIVKGQAEFRHHH